MTFKIRNPDFEQRIRDNFALQSAMDSFGMVLAEIEPGFVMIEMKFNPDFTQQHGFHHAGVATSAMDSACGYAALSLMEANAEVLTVEFKANFLAPAKGERFRFCGEVIKAGKTLSMCEGKAFAYCGSDSPKLIATLNATMMAVYDI